MKKNLRIVSAAAAALLAVAPIAATAMPVNAATTATTATTANKPTVDLSGAGSVSESKDTVNVTPSFTLTSAIATDKGVVTTPATLKGSIEASLNGTSVTADVADVAKDVTLKNGDTVVYSYDAKTISLLITWVLMTHLLRKHM